MRTGGSGSVIIDTDDSGGKEIKLRQIEVCDGGITRKIIVLASEPFD